MSVKVTEAWAEAPLRSFIDDSRVLLALLMHPSGQVVGQTGFARAMDVMSACALGAAIHATASELGRQLDGKPFNGMHYAGKEKQVFLAPTDTPGGKFLLLAVFDEAASLGLVQLYFTEFRERLAKAAPARTSSGPVLNAHFEGELNKNLADLFGRP
jgi:predicted regulator of Ras-like GTPase activity (Roadblock/LC7/MglB family)